MDCKKKHKSSRSRSRERHRSSRPKVKESKRSWQSRNISDTSSSDSSLYSKPVAVKRKHKKHKHESRHKSSDESKVKKFHKRRHSSRSDSSSVERKKKKKKRKKKKHKKLKEEKNKYSEAVKECGDSNAAGKTGEEVQDKDSIGPTPNLMAPMTKEAWDKQQSVTRYVTDETGRRRLVKGDGEILEEIVSREKHQEINKQATKGDALHYQFQMGLLK